MRRAAKTLREKVETERTDRDRASPWRADAQRYASQVRSSVCAMQMEL
jgi:hypothetical protein